ncbi:MAG: EAL domain-containing protein, partial [Pseudobdellovibrionaceae bacterium]
MQLSLFRIQKALKSVCIAAAFCLAGLTFLSLFLKHADHSVLVSGVVMVFLAGGLLLEVLRRHAQLRQVRRRIENVEEAVTALSRFEERVVPFKDVKETKETMSHPVSIAVPSQPKTVVQIRDSLTQHKVSDAQVRTLLNTARNENWIDLFVQPVVSLPQRQAQFYEVFGRLRMNDTTYISGARYLPLAEERDMTTVLDRILLMRALDTLRKLHMNGRARPYMLNIEAASLIDQTFMNDLLRFVSTN